MTEKIPPEKLPFIDFAKINQKSSGSEQASSGQAYEQLFNNEDISPAIDEYTDTKPSEKAGGGMVTKDHSETGTEPVKKPPVDFATLSKVSEETGLEPPLKPTPLTPKPPAKPPMVTKAYGEAGGDHNTPKPPLVASKVSEETGFEPPLKPDPKPPAKPPMVTKAYGEAGGDHNIPKPPPIKPPVDYTTKSTSEEGGKK